MNGQLGIKRVVKKSGYSLLQLMAPKDAMATHLVHLQDITFLAQGEVTLK